MINRENRLIAVYPTTPEAGDRKLVFAYDYMSRRVQKLVYVWNDLTELWITPAQTDLKFVYAEGFNVALVLDGTDSDAVETTYTWGLDLSGSVQGAGGIGGLLAVDDSGTNYWFFYDANGNVGQAVKASDYSVAGHYEYDPYGNVINDLSHYTYAQSNPMRFSTKWFDTEQAEWGGDNGAIGESGLGYWGYRYYSPRLGRWLNRDPIGEKGGLNLYTAVTNASINWVDALGRQMFPDDPIQEEEDLIGDLLEGLVCTVGCNIACNIICAGIGGPSCPIICAVACNVATTTKSCNTTSCSKPKDPCPEVFSRVGVGCTYLGEKTRCKTNTSEGCPGSQHRIVCTSCTCKENPLNPHGIYPFLVEDEGASRTYGKCQ